MKNNDSNSEKMNAIICTKYGPPEVLTIQTVDKPIPKDNEILIKIHTAIVSPTDCGFRKGSPFITRLFVGLRKPKYIPGDIFAGEIEAIGKDISKFKVGDQIFGATGTKFGAHAEYRCLTEDAAIAIKPANISFSEAVTIGDGGITALPFLRDTGNIKEGQNVLVNGASGAVGSFAIQVAKYYGAKVTGVCSTSNTEMVKLLGADKVFDYTKEDFTKSNEKYDIIFDAVAKSSFSDCKSILKDEGVYLTTVPTTIIMFQSLWTKIFGKKKAKFAATGLRPDSDKTKDLKFLIDLMEKGKIRSIIDREYSMNEIVEAHTYVEKGHKKGNVILKIS